MGTVILVLLALWLLTGLGLGLWVHRLRKSLVTCHRLQKELRRQLADKEDEKEVRSASDDEALREFNSRVPDG